MKKKILFMCAEGEVRSPTAYYLYKNKYDCWYIAMSYLQELAPNAIHGILRMFEIIIVFEEFMDKYIRKYTDDDHLIFNLEIKDLKGIVYDHHLIDEIEDKINKSGVLT